ncbi:hypothetical protein T484DRAFT_1945131 [Baffinella frigidus]|nr:hypothetical protein T484DRAFT_1945131 [Cryptophyta sp. CCMP2293]
MWSTSFLLALAENTYSSCFFRTSRGSCKYLPNPFRPNPPSALLSAPQFRGSPSSRESTVSPEPDSCSTSSPVFTAPRGSSTAASKTCHSPASACSSARASPIIASASRSASKVLSSISISPSLVSCCLQRSALSAAPPVLETSPSPAGPCVSRYSER